MRSSFRIQYKILKWQQAVQNSAQVRDFIMTRIMVSERQPCNKENTDADFQPTSGWVQRTRLADASGR
jgi:SH3-like domain-containing protein